MTIAIAAKFDGGVLCATDTAITYGENRFHSPVVKGVWRWDGFVMYAGAIWVCHQILNEGNEREQLEDGTLGNLLTLEEVILRATTRWKDKENEHPDIPAEFLKVDFDGNIKLLDSGMDFAGFDYACIGAGTTTAMPALDLLYKRVRNRTLTNTKRMLLDVLRVCEKYDTTVYRPFKFEEVKT